MQIQKINFEIASLHLMRNYPKDLFYIGSTTLLKKPKIAIVGSRKPNQYARELTQTIASKLANAGVVVVSGGAMGIDAVAHKAAGASNTIMVAGTGLDKRYPAVNKNLIAYIEQKGLVLSQFEAGTPSQKYNFPLRNELVVALGDALVVSYADKNSGTMRSVEYALKMDKKIFVLPHRIGESEATNELLEQGLAEPIYDVDKFVACYGVSDVIPSQKDPFSEYCKTHPTYEEAIEKDAQKVFEYELAGKIRVESGVVYPV
ncbi:MAG: DNA-protecting protein DprA [Epsilonproteobacteria bacterium]|nr:DNA-protecting protein DprA [Campylobacterota bacterium]